MPPQVKKPYRSRSKAVEARSAYYVNVYFHYVKKRLRNTAVKAIAFKLPLK